MLFRSIRNGVVQLTIALNAPQPTDTIVTLTNTDPSVLFVSQSATIPAGQIGVILTPMAMGPNIGTVTITATLPALLGGSSASATVTVIDQMLSFTPPDQTIAVGTPATVTVHLGIPQPTDTVISLFEGPVSSGHVPASVTVLAGSTTATFNVNSSTPANVSVNGSLPPTVTPGGFASAQVHFILPAGTPILLAPATQTIHVGPPGGLLTVYLQSASTTDTSVTISSSDPTVVNPITPFVIPANGVTTLVFTFQQSYDKLDNSERIYMNLLTPGCEPYPIDRHN